MFVDGFWAFRVFMVLGVCWMAFRLLGCLWFLGCWVFRVFRVVRVLGF